MGASLGRSFSRLVTVDLDAARQMPEAQLRYRLRRANRAPATATGCEMWCAVICGGERRSAQSWTASLDTGHRVELHLLPAKRWQRWLHDLGTPGFCNPLLSDLRTIFCTKGSCPMLRLLRDAPSDGLLYLPVLGLR